MRLRYTVQVTIPVMVEVEGDYSDSCGWREEFEKVGADAIKNVISGFREFDGDLYEQLGKALERLETDGLGYPSDFSEVCGSEQVAEDEGDLPMMLRRQAD